MPGQPRHDEAQDQDRRDGRLEPDTALTDVLEKNGINQLPVEVTLA
ncbi:hypothetical protein OG613_04285 [Streptomyces sp. NBC_00015]